MDHQLRIDLLTVVYRVVPIIEDAIKKLVYSFLENMSLYKLSLIKRSPLCFPNKMINGASAYLRKVRMSLGVR